MKPALLLYIDWTCGRWTIQYRNPNGELVNELTDYPASVPSLVVSNAIQRMRPDARVLAKLF